MDRGTKIANGKTRAKAAPSRAKPRKTDARTVGQRLQDAQAQQAAVNEILRVMADAPADVTIVLNAIAEQAAHLCHAPFARVTVAQDGVLRVRAGYEADGNPRAPAQDVPLRRTSIQGRALIERKTLHFADIAPLVDKEFPDARENARIMGFRAVLAVPLVRGDEGLGAMFLYRREPGLFAPDQVALVETFARQAAIALHSVQQFRATREALEQQTATSEILRVISSSPTDAPPVFETIAAAALKLCHGASSTLHTYDGKLLHIGALASTTPEGAEAIRAVFPRPAGMDNGVTRAVFTRDLVQIPDILLDADYATTESAMEASFRSVIAVPLMKDGDPIGAISVGRPEPGPFPASQVALLQTFADQAVIAIENVRLFTELQARNRDLTETLEQQTATSDILRVISRSPTDVQPVFETMCAAALTLCGAMSANVFTFDGQLVHLKAMVNVNPAYGELLHKSFPRAPAREFATSRAILARDVCAIPDVLADPDYGDAPQSLVGGFRSVLAAPLLRHGEAIGAIVVGRPEPGAFPASQIALLQTFADQAVIAIENVRLFTELASRNRDLTEALEQQTATGDILRVISGSPTDVQPVFETIANATLKLCRAVNANVYTFDGELIRLAAVVNINPGYFAAIHEVFPRAPGRDTAVGRAIRECGVVIIEDVLDDPEYMIRHASLAGGFRSVLAVPLMRDGKPVGAIIVGAPEPGTFPDAQIALLQTFADQAVIAIENVRLFTELESRNRDLTEALEQQTATSDILRVISQSPTDVQPVFDEIALSAARLCAAEFCHVFRFDGTLLHFASSHGLSKEALEAVRQGYPLRPGRASAAARAVLTGRVEEIEDVDADAEYEHAWLAAIMTFKSIVAVPMIHHGVPVGAIALAQSRKGAFPERQVELLKTFADQAVIAIENVRLFNELQTRNRELTEALDHQTGTGDVLRIISRSPTDVQPVFDAIAESAARLCSAPFCHVFRFDGELIHFAASHGLPAEGLAAVQAAYPLPPGHASAAARAVASGAIVQVPDVQADADYEHGAVAKASSFRSIMAVPMLHQGKVIGAIALTHTRMGFFPERQVELLKTFADQAVIAIENVRLFTELETRNRDLTEALEQQTATSEVLRVMSGSPTDVQPVFDTIARSALRLCDAVFSVLYRFDGELIHIGALANLDEAGTAAFRNTYPCRPNRGGTTQRSILTRQVVHMPDVREDPEYTYGAVAELAHFRSVLAVPMLRDGVPIGTLSVYRDVPRAFPPGQIELLKTFADQAVIAIENVRLFTELGQRNRDLTEALEQQTATSEILRAISGSPTDTSPVFAAIANAALKLCAAQSANVVTFDGALVHVAALAVPEGQESTTIRGHFDKYPRPPSRETANTRAVLTRSVVMIPDVLEDADYSAGATAVAAGYRSVLAVPLLRNSVPMGAVTVARPEAGPFPASQVALLQTFADQAVIAIENVRLFTEVQARNRELTEALEQQTATSEILRVISRSQTDVQPVFETIVHSVLALCDAQFSGVYLLEDVTLSLAATAGLTGEERAAFEAGYPRKAGPAAGVSGLAALECRVVQTLDLLNDPQYAGAPGTRVGARTVLGVPLLRDGRSIGSIGVWRTESKAFSETQIALLQTFADQAVIAIENVRLFKELEARTAQLTRSVSELQALGEVGQAVSSTLDVETVLGTIVARVTQLAGMDGGSIYEYDEVREEFHLHSANGLPVEVVEALRSAPIRKGEGALGKLATTGHTVEIHDVADERVYQSRVRNALMRIGYRSMLVVPLLRENHLLGGLVVNRRATGAFDASAVELLKTFATQSAIAIQNARLFREIEIKSRELETASRHKSEFLANMSHELRTPLNAIIGFSEVLAERLFGELNDKQAEYVTDISESGHHLLELINDILDLSKIEAGRMELDTSEFDLPRAIAQTLSLVRERAERRAIAVSLAVDPGVTTIRADERKVKQVLLNLLSNALKFTPEGGSIVVTAADLADRIEVSVRDTGVGIAPEDHEKVFEEFRQVGTSAARTEGTGLGLAISRKFIELHGGRLWVASGLGRGSTFTFSLPRR